MTREGQLNCVELYTYISWVISKKKIAPIFYVNVCDEYFMRHSRAKRPQAPLPFDNRSYVPPPLATAAQAPNRDLYLPLQYVRYLYTLWAVPERKRDSLAFYP